MTNPELKARLDFAYAFFRASLMLFFFVIILEVFQWAWKGKLSEVAQTLPKDLSDSSVISQYLGAIVPTLVGVSAIFWAFSKVSWKTWMKITKVLAIEHLFEEEDKLREADE